MGAHTAVAHALRAPRALAGLVLAGPVYAGEIGDLAYWDGLADGLERGGIDGFLASLDEQSATTAEWRQTVLRFTRERMERHRDLDAVAVALREVPRSRPFGSLAELASLELPALVVASRDEADPGHPLAVAEAYADRLPDARLVGEGEGESPLAWQGGRLSREVASFCAELGV
jgi:pimeloyl-ACP methyl ester carboxylesterase